MDLINRCEACDFYVVYLCWGQGRASTLKCLQQGVPRKDHHMWWSASWLSCYFDLQTFWCGYLGWQLDVSLASHLWPRDHHIGLHHTGTVRLGSLLESTFSSGRYKLYSRLFWICSPGNRDWANFRDHKTYSSLAHMFFLLKKDFFYSV